MGDLNPDRRAETFAMKLDASIAYGLADAKAGRVESARDVFERLDAKYQALIDAAADRARAGRDTAPSRTRD